MNHLSLSSGVTIVIMSVALGALGCSSGSESDATKSATRSQQSALQACTSGDTRLADDGCNECECVDDVWQCSELACVAESPGDLSPGLPNAPPAPPTNPAPPTKNVCADGQQKTSSDGCNTCTCAGGSWACTELDCITPAPSKPPAPPPVTPKVCREGDEATAADGCNWCWCDGNGWHCTQLGCEG